jgi:TRAP-type C4-dicarboxylate transport system permease small subunit
VRTLTRLAATGANALIVALFLALFGQVALRPAGVLFPWVEEFATYSFIVMVFFAVARAHGSDEHLNVGFFQQFVTRRSARAGRLLRLFNRLAELAFLLVFLTGLVLMTRQSWEMFAGSLSGFRVGWVYLASGVAVLVSVMIIVLSLAGAARDNRGADGRASAP